MRRRIRYYLRALGFPSGGAMQIRQHVRVLNEQGFDAAIVIDSEADNQFYDFTVPTILYRDFHITKSDVCVVPEAWRAYFLKLKDIKADVVCFCQNHHSIHRGFVDNEDFSAFGVSTVMCCSQQVASHVERYYDVQDVAVVPCGINIGERHISNKDMSISFMPRKSPLDATFIRDLLPRRYPSLRDIPWVAIHGVPHATAMDIVGRTSVFLSMSHREGLGLPPLEAMSSKTLVVGFHGGGGLDYATARNGFWLEEGDLVGCVDALHDAISGLRVQSARTSDMLDQGKLTADRYSMDHMRDRLVEFWTDRA